MSTPSLHSLMQLAQEPSWQRLLGDLQEVSEAVGVSVYLVGGVVRDSLLHVHDTIHDIDLTVDGDAIALGTALAKRWQGRMKPYPKFLTARVLPGIPMPGGMKEIDLAACRTEVYSKPGSDPLVQRATLKEDLTRRDFTINGLALSLHNLLHESSEERLRQSLFDSSCGYEDIQNRCVRIFHDKSFSDDPTRILRALRYKVQTKGFLSEETQHALSERLSNPILPDVNKARLSQEFLRTLRALTLMELVTAWEELRLTHAIPLWEAEYSSDIKTISKNLMNLNYPQSWKEQAFLFACFTLSREESSLFSAVTGSGKKTLSRWKRDSVADAQECSTAALLAYHCGGDAKLLQHDSDAAIEEELTKRYQHYEQQSS